MTSGSARSDVLPPRWTHATIDLDAVAHNIGFLRDAVAPAALWAVVKADAYGHGAVEVSRAALDAGAAGLCVALVEEAVELRGAGIDAPILLLSQQPDEYAEAIVEYRLTPTLYTRAGIVAMSAAAARRGGEPLDVHVKIDTGMQRAGAQLPAAIDIVRAVDTTPGIRLAGVFTHLAVADEPTDPASTEQLARFDTLLDELRAEHLLDEGVVVHAANSAGALAHRTAHHQLVRAGIALYGISPGRGVADLSSALRPVLSLSSRVSLVKPVAAGSGVSYGLRHRFAHDTTVATVPIGYADGVPRRLGASGRGEEPGPDTGAVLIGGRRCPIVGVVTMDQIVVDVGDAPVCVGDEVVLIGAQAAGGDDAVVASDRITAEEWAELVGTIGYEITCGVSRRVPRRYTSGGMLRDAVDTDDRGRGSAQPAPGRSIGP